MDAVDRFAPAAHPSFAEMTSIFARIGLLSFGGPAGQIALMHTMLVDERRWISEARFLHALNYCMLLPGPEAQQLATYIGWLLHGTRGGVVAGVLFILPGLLVILALSAAYALFGETTVLSSLFYGLKAAVLAIVIEATLRVSRRALKTRLSLMIAGAAFIALFLFSVPFPIVILAAGLVGFANARLFPIASVTETSTTGADSAIDRIALLNEARHAPSLGRALRVILLWGALWLAPLLLIILLEGPSGRYADIFSFFSQMAVVTFGGAYAVLTYVAQEAVIGFGWLQPGEMIDGLALAETTPGPLVLVLSFVAFLAGFRDPSGMPPLLGGILGGLLAAWVTFVPCFLWIFLGAPYIERLRNNRTLAAALGAITAAVVGVILNLAAWFGLHLIFRKVDPARFGPLSLPWPNWGSFDALALAMSIAAIVLLVGFRFGTVRTLALFGGLGLLSALLPQA